MHAIEKFEMHWVFSVEFTTNLNIFSFPTPYENYQTKCGTQIDSIAYYYTLRELKSNRIESNRIFWFICCGIKKTHPHAVSVTAFVVFIESFIFHSYLYENCAHCVGIWWWHSGNEHIWNFYDRHEHLGIDHWIKKKNHLFGSTKYYRKYSW